MTRNLAILVGGMVAFWVLLAYPARLLGGDAAVIFSAVAGLICLLPAAGTLIWTRVAFRGSPERQLAAVLGGTGVRMLFVVGVGMAVFHTLPYFHYVRFWIWVIVFYLFTLALELGVLLLPQPGADRSTTGEGA